MSARTGTIRQGVTLLELICVAAIMIIAAAIGIPVMQTMLVDARMTAAGDMVRGRLADARSKALNEGCSWKLGFLANTGTFQLAPDDSSEWENVNQTSTEQPGVIRDDLPQDVIFGLNQADVQGAAGAGAPGAKWETIAVYRWDGSAIEDKTIYFGHPGLVPMRVNVRGLTGAVSIEIPMTVQAGQP